MSTRRIRVAAQRQHLPLGGPEPAVDPSRSQCRELRMGLSSAALEPPLCA